MCTLGCRCIKSVLLKRSKRTNNDLEGTHLLYLRFFGIHLNLWTYAGKVKDLQRKKKIEENGQRLGGNLPTRQPSRVIRKEDKLQNLKDLFMANQHVTLIEVYKHLVPPC